MCARCLSHRYHPNLHSMNTSILSLIIIHTHTHNIPSHAWHLLKCISHWGVSLFYLSQLDGRLGLPVNYHDFAIFIKLLLCAILQFSSWVQLRLYSPSCGSSMGPTECSEGTDSRWIRSFIEKPEQWDSQGHGPTLWKTGMCSLFRQIRQVPYEIKHW